MKFQSEKIIDSIEEAKPLLYKHWQEIAHYKDIELNPDYEFYFKMEELGLLKVFSARDDDDKLIGYSVFFIKHNPHYKQSLVAIQDILFFDPDKRGAGGYFIKWCDEKLKELGVQVVSHHVKKAHNFGPGLERMGYELQDLVYTKRLDK